ncbi:hypothetical protein [Bradyrhizobium stylosanthis]|uniref:Uncharacterized protein n=1 Tax=Bradyrhizobium stylosanthis TaxID=1803665 RepID=A0A560D2P3_9BRAD|nr:hypothetical protein [Bradyrhizobium stylosanthis]TWA91351.1 hypothetical protein FBZ96_11359 [Bradyrhizobium stylosanthis]
MPAAKLAAALAAVNWAQNVQNFLGDQVAAEGIAKANMRVAVWSRQFENSDKGNPALCFVREMQVAGTHVAALVALALYKPAAASMRAMLETGLYYTYFRTHPSELASLVRNADYFIDKRELLDYHKRHTAEFTALQAKLGLLSRLDKWYSEISAVVHGQVPGAWVEQHTLAKTSNIVATQKLVVEKFIDGTDILHRLFLCTAGKALWDTFSTEAKRELLRGLPGDAKAELALDIA